MEWRKYCQCAPPTPPHCSHRTMSSTPSSSDDNITLNMVASRALVRLASRSIARSLVVMPLVMTAQCMCCNCRPPPPAFQHQQQMPPPQQPPQYDEVSDPSYYYTQRPDDNNNLQGQHPYYARMAYGQYRYMGEDRPAGYD